MTILPVHLFKDTFGPFVALLNEHNIKYQMREVRAGVPMASGGTLEIVQAIGNAAFWASLATVVVAFINSRRGRKVIITMKDGTVVHAEGLSQTELETVLEKVQNLTVIDLTKAENESAAP
jgi:Effector Associated Constant Component 1